MVALPDSTMDLHHIILMPERDASTLPAGTADTHIRIPVGRYNDRECVSATLLYGGCLSTRCRRRLLLTLLPMVHHLRRYLPLHSHTLTVPPAPRPSPT